MGCMNCKCAAPRNLGDKAMMLIKIAPGNAQATKLNSASIGPPNLSPKTVIVWVVEGPGSKLQKAFTSFSVS